MNSADWGAWQWVVFLATSLVLGILAGYIGAWIYDLVHPPKL